MHLGTDANCTEDLVQLSRESLRIYITSREGQGRSPLGAWRHEAALGNWGEGGLVLGMNWDFGL